MGKTHYKWPCSIAIGYVSLPEGIIPSKSQKRAENPHPKARQQKSRLGLGFIVD